MLSKNEPNERLIPTMVVPPWDGYSWRSKRVGILAICAVCLVFFASFHLPQSPKPSVNHKPPTETEGPAVRKYGSEGFVNTQTPVEQETAILFLANYPKFPSGTPLGDLHYLKAVLIARLFNPSTPIFILLPNSTVSNHPDMITLLGSYRVNIRWIEDVKPTPSLAVFQEKHWAFCERLKIRECYDELMYIRFGMAAQLLKAEGFRRALFLDTDVGLYENISFFTQYPEDFVSAFDWTTQVALWDVETMDHYFSWLLHYFDTEPGPLRHDPGDMFTVQAFLRRHPLTSRHVFCQPHPKVAPLHCSSGPVFQAMESVQHVGCNLTLVHPSECPLLNCRDKFDEWITWKQDEQGRYVPFLRGLERLPVMHFSNACKNIISTKMYPVALEGIELATDRTNP